MSEPFDFDAFIRGTSLARRTVSAFRVDNRDEIAQLIEAFESLPENAGDERESDGPSTRDEIAARIAALREDMESSRVQWTLRTLGPEEFKQIVNADTDEPFDQIAMQSRAPERCANPSLYTDLPNLTADQWRQISRVIGSRQWGDLVDSATALIISKVAVPDFSPNSSTTRTPLGLSAN
jgi:hypothetical protein